MCLSCGLTGGNRASDYGQRGRSIHLPVTYVKLKREENFGLFRERYSARWHLIKSIRLSAVAQKKS